MTKRYISSIDLSKNLEKLHKLVAERIFEYTVTDYYVTFKMSREMFDDLNNKIEGRTL